MVSMQARRHALQEADTLLRELDVAQDAPIDVFALIEQLDLELVFNDLKTILGALLRHGDGGGIMLSTQRGAAVQRYTAAHEIGHWILGHEAACDTEADLYTPSHDREQLAQIFASQLLMPPPLVYATAARYGVTNSETATGPLVYHIARDMGASYEAVVRQLDNLGMINRHKRDELLAIQPGTIKTQLSLGHRPVGQVDVWPVDVGFSGGAITVTEGDEIVIVLPENRSTGYQWLTEADLRERAERRVQPPPPIDPKTVIRNPDLDWVPGPELAHRRSRRSTGHFSAFRATPAQRASCAPMSPTWRSRTRLATNCRATTKSLSVPSSTRLKTLTTPRGRPRAHPSGEHCVDPLPEVSLSP